MQRQRKSLPIGICVSWTKVCLLLLAFYGGIAFYVLQFVLAPGSTVLGNLRVRHTGKKWGAVYSSQQQLPTGGLVDADHAFRIQQIEQQIQQLDGNAFASFRSCRWREGGVYASDDSCPSEASEILYFNPHSEARIICDQTIPANSHLLRKLPCSEPARLFPVIPDITAKGLAPVKTCFDRCSSVAQPFDDCDIPCLHSGHSSLMGTRRIDGTNWTIRFSMEGPQYYPIVRVKKQAYRESKFYSTTSYESEIPLPYFSWAEYKIHSPPIDYDSAIKGAVFLARNCNSRNNREQLIRQLQATSFRVDSLSTCLQNAKPPPGVNLKDKIQVMQHYLFYLAFENQNEPDYITEKLWGPLVAGTVPVYFGAPNVKEHVPNRSIIVVDDFESIDHLAAYLEKLASNKELYEEYHAWRFKTLPPHFHAKYDFTRVHSTCRTCRWAHAKLYGLGWDHGNQTLTQLRTERKVCIGRNRLLEKPFREEWLSLPGTVDETAITKASLSCERLPWSGISHYVAPHRIKRTVYEQDGAIDFLIETYQGTEQHYVIRLHLPLEETRPLVHDVKGKYYIQDGRTRFTLLVIPKDAADVKISAKKPAAVDVVPRKTQSSFRIRVIVEDVDTFHEDAEDETTYFTQRMIRDFYSPVEKFVRS